MKQVCCIPSFKPLFHILHLTGTQIFALDLFPSFPLDSVSIGQSQRPLNPSDFELHPTSKLNICKTILFICYRWTLKYVIDRLKSQTYLGRITSTRFPLLCIALLRLRTKSPKFPHSVIGFSSVHICVICNPYLNIPNHRKPVSF